jgi:outer membrane protein assembly factor BamB
MTDPPPAALFPSLAGPCKIHAMRLRLAPLRVSRSASRACLAATLLLGSLAISTDAEAVGTRTFVLDSLEKLSGGDLKGTAVSSDGAVRAGFTLGNAPIPDAAAVFSGVTLNDGTVLVGTSPNGKIFRLNGDAVSLFAETGTLAVTSIVQAKNGTIYAASMPEGKIFRVSQGKAEPFATLPETSHVWALTTDKNGTGLFAATGPEGKVFHVEANGSSAVYYRSSETHIVSLALADNGDLYAGSSGKGQLYRITGPGRASVLYTMPGEEVKAIVVGKGGVVWAISNEYGEPPEPPKRAPTAGRTPAGPSPAARGKPGKGNLFRFDAQGRPERMMKHDDTHYLSLALDDKGQAYVGTGANGRLYTVDDAHVITLLADTDERQVGAISFAGGKGFIASGDPAVLHRILGKGGADAVWTSKVLDATLRARFGVASWRASGALEISTRTGSTSSPDATWTPWSNPLPAPGPITSGPGRYVQIRARWTRDPNAVLSEVTIPFVTDNIRPVVTEVSATAKTSPTKEPVKEGIPVSGGEPSKHDSVVKLSWKVDNPDSDPLRYRIAFKREGQAQWRDALKADEVHTKTEFEWDTSALPEGKYRLRVEASDEQANTPDQTQKHALDSEPVLVDNTPPRIDGLSITGRRLKGRIIDGTSPIARVEVAVDGKIEWRPVTATDGIFDTLDEAIDADVSALVPPGSHIVMVRAYDAAGNAVTRDVEAR